MVTWFMSRPVQGVLTLAWLTLIIPTILWWRDSLLWIALMSVYACFIGHLSTYAASRAEDEAKANGGQ